MQRQGGNPCSSFGSHQGDDSAFLSRRLAWVPCPYMRQSVQYLLPPEWLCQIFRATGTHGCDDLVRTRVAGSGKNAYAVIAAFVNPLAGPDAFLALVKIDHADAMLKLLQHPHNFARGNMPINVVHDMGSGRLGSQGLQPFPRVRIHIYAEDADTPLGTA